MELLIKYGNIVMTTTTGHRVWYHLCLLLLVHLAGYIVNLSDFYSYRIIGKLTKSKVGLTLAKVATLRITLNLDGVSITSRTHTHPSHSQTSRLLELKIIVFSPSFVLHLINEELRIVPLGHLKYVHTGAYNS